MNKISGVLVLIMLLTGTVVALALGSRSVLDRQRAAQERRFAEDKHAIEIRRLQEQADIATQEALQLAPVKTAALGLGMMSVALATLGGAVYFTAEMRKRSLLIHPNANGLYPIIRIVLSNGVIVMHDPNRMPVATMAYSVDGQLARMSPLILPGLEQSVQQAAAIQVTTAAMHRGTRPTVGQAMDIAQHVMQNRAGDAITIGPERVEPSTSDRFQRKQ